MKTVVLFIFQMILYTTSFSQESKFMDVTGIDYEGKKLIDSIRNEVSYKGIEYNTLVMLFTKNLNIQNSIFQDKFLLFLVSKPIDSVRNIIIILNNRIYKDTLLKFNCWYDKELLYLSYDNKEMPYNLEDGFFIPELPGGGSNSYFSLHQFEKNDTYFFEADIKERNVFLDKPDKKKKRDEVAKTITSCLIEILEKL